MTQEWSDPPRRQVYSNGTVEMIGNPGAIKKLTQWLDQLGALRTGKKIFATLKGFSGAPVRIVHWDAPTITLAGLDLPWVQKNQPSWACGLTTEADYLSSCAVTWSPKEHWLAPGRGVSRGAVFVSWDYPYICINHEDQGEYPGCGMIGHELIHAIHAIRGEWLNKYRSVDELMYSMEEARTIGCRSEHYDQEELSENAIRSELGLSILSTHQYGHWDDKGWTRVDGTGPVDTQLWTLQQNELAAGRQSALPLHLQQQADDAAMLQMTPPTPRK